MIVAAAAVCLDLNQSEVRIEQERAARGKAGCVRRKLICIALPSEFASVTAVIREAQGCTEPEVTFDGEIPFIDLRLFIVSVTGLLEALGSQLRKLRRKRIRKRKQRLRVHPCL